MARSRAGHGLLWAAYVGCVAAASPAQKETQGTQGARQTPVARQDPPGFSRIHARYSWTWSSLAALVCTRVCGQQHRKSQHAQKHQDRSRTRIAESSILGSSVRAELCMQQHASDVKCLRASSELPAGAFKVKRGAHGSARLNQAAFASPSSLPKNLRSEYSPRR